MTPRERRPSPPGVSRDCPEEQQANWSSFVGEDGGTGIGKIECGWIPPLEGVTMEELLLLCGVGEGWRPR
ncbi:MAG: hypothetical protein AUJ92_14260 [Armatimonadetes bacterium CG2_30_59_28]|nr:hypothetical protein [Armatimonadota bacterium]OIO92456.1 MAG: hypothetical protein AUJ92_14260 [Armatimonadetes bacterium CG2_30_59_28]PIU62454.1 MAG: hypothetical protein COS85_18480 [Armatimonadetes bacterium CG07_land_8_20_14_0_80_59_28]PIX44251.1 MAG: hypothetical protein COZ56_04990 [Armatimonadetes bacterium CG_4_8_14_3_um_filter_58_9]PJB76022.1 MAG: hypothetical protein CO095_03065 [Armatimonadetes bacterium CG_4_9_14_3_um_filter_58_7]